MSQKRYAFCVFVFNNGQPLSDVMIPEEREALVQQMTHTGASSLKGSASSNVYMWRTGFNCMFKYMLTAIGFEYIIAVLPRLNTAMECICHTY
jgi:hypothetical protein